MAEKKEAAKATEKAEPAHKLTQTERMRRVRDRLRDDDYFSDPKVKETSPFGATPK